MELSPENPAIQGAPVHDTDTAKELKGCDWDGRPMPEHTARSKASEHTALVIRTLAKIMRAKNAANSDKINAAKVMHEMAYGRMLNRSIVKHERNVPARLSTAITNSNKIVPIKGA